MPGPPAIIPKTASSNASTPRSHREATGLTDGPGREQYLPPHSRRCPLPTWTGLPACPGELRRRPRRPNWPDLDTPHHRSEELTDLRRLALGAMMPTFEGYEAPEWLLELIREGLGAVALFTRNIGSPEQLSALVASLRQERPDLIMAIDEGAGDATRLYHAIRSPVTGTREAGQTGEHYSYIAVGSGGGRDGGWS